MKNKNAEKFVKSLPTGEPEYQSMGRAISDALLLEKFDGIPLPRSDVEDPEGEIRRVVLEDAFRVIEAHMKEGGLFTNAQCDLGVELSLRILAPPDREKFREVAQHNGIPLWQALWGQWRRCDDWGLAFTPILDPGWSPTEVRSLEVRTCPVCEKKFQPKDWGQIYDENTCGAEAERRVRDARLAEEEQLRAIQRAEVEKSEPKPDVKATDFSRPPELDPMTDIVPAEVLE